MKVKYYHLRDSNMSPRLTRCILQDGERIAIGTSLCSLSDFPCKKDGRNRAFGRAMKALLAERNILPINRAEADDVLCAVDADILDYSVLKSLERDFKGLYIEDEGHLNPLERKLLEIN